MKCFFPVFLTISAWAQSDPCISALGDLHQMDMIPTFGSESGVALFMDRVGNSDIGRSLATCPGLADTAWDEILKSGGDGIGNRGTLNEQLRIGVLMVIYGNHLTRYQFDRLRSFVRLRPWRNGFWFTSSIAIDDLLAYKQAPSRDALYHSYTKDEMEAALKRYAR